MSNLNGPRCRPGLPLTVVLGAGAVRGMAHIGVLEILQDAGFHVNELVGTSVGALIAGFYGPIGLDMARIRELGLGLRSSHLLAWALLRRLPEGLRRQYDRWAGCIPSHIDQLEQGSFETMHHGLSRVGIVAYDLISRRQVVCHSDSPIIRLEDAVRGAVAVPGLFQPWRCVGTGVDYELVDAGTKDRLPLEVVFEPPFQPRQVLGVDISSTIRDREESLARLARLRARFPHIPMDCLCVDTQSGRSVVYRQSHSLRFLESGRQAAREYLAREGKARDLARQSSSSRFDVAGAGVSVGGRT